MSWSERGPECISQQNDITPTLTIFHAECFDNAGRGSVQASSDVSSYGELSTTYHKNISRQDLTETSLNKIQKENISTSSYANNLDKILYGKISTRSYGNISTRSSRNRPLGCMHQPLQHYQVSEQLLSEIRPDNTGDVVSLPV